MWTVGYACFVLVAGLCARRVLAAGAANSIARPVLTTPAIRWAVRARWIAMAALPSALMIGTTTFLLTDVAAVPLLWVIPLALYLLSFVAAFARRPLSVTVVSRAAVCSSLAVAASLLLTALEPTLALPIWILVGVHGANLFFIALLVHGRLASERPPAERLTEFYSPALDRRSHRREFRCTRRAAAVLHDRGVPARDRARPAAPPRGVPPAEGRRSGATPTSCCRSPSSWERSSSRR